MSTPIQPTDESGQTTTEYGVVLGVLVLGVVTVIGVLSTAFQMRVTAVATLIASLVG